MRIPGYSRYDIDEHGNLVDTSTGEPVKRHDNARYAWVTVIPDNTTDSRQVNLHVLMALTFCGPKPDGGIVRFLDGDNTNICAANLAWTTRSELGTTLARNTVKARKPKKNNTCTKESMQMLHDTLCTLDEPVSMTTLSNMLEVPYSVIRYSMYGLIASGKAKAVEGGYVRV